MTPPQNVHVTGGAGRVLWILWCLGWAGLWLLLAGLRFAMRVPLGGFVFLALASLSGAAIFLPVGKSRPRQ